MRAELAGKLSTSTQGPQDRREDTLTDAVFSALRYLPREVLSDWLRTILPERFRSHATAEAAQGAGFSFWPALPGGIEPDVVLRVGSLMVVIEAKYESPFSTGIRHQLTDEWRQARLVAEIEAFDGPVVVAITKDLVEPLAVDIARRQLEEDERFASAGISVDEAVVWCPWQSVAQAIERAERSSWRIGEEALVEDLLEFMRSRGVSFVYEGFRTEDWWLLGAAAAAGSERVYPTVAEFAREVTAQGKDRGLVWGGTDSGVIWYESKHPTNAHTWHRNYIQLPFMHSQFGQRTSLYCTLYVLFTFNHPAIRAGWWFQLYNKEHFTSRANGIAHWLQATDPAFEIIDNPDWAQLPVPFSREVVTAEWVRERITKGARLRVERVWEPSAVTLTAPVIDVLVDLAESLLKDGTILDALEAEGILNRSQPPAEVTTPPALTVDGDALSGGGEEV